jgi:hypothetical protein
MADTRETWMRCTHATTRWGKKTRQGARDCCHDSSSSRSSEDSVSYIHRPPGLSIAVCHGLSILLCAAHQTVYFVVQELLVLFESLLIEGAGELQLLQLRLVTRSVVNRFLQRLCMLSACIDRTVPQSPPLLW